jgi:hypothetical protein
MSSNAAQKKVTVYEITIAATGAELQFLSMEDAHRSMGMCLTAGMDFSFMVRDTKMGSKSHKRIIEWNRQFSTMPSMDPQEAQAKLDVQMQDCPVTKTIVQVEEEIVHEELVVPVEFVPVEFVPVKFVPIDQVVIEDTPIVIDSPTCESDSDVTIVSTVVEKKKVQKTKKSKEICSMVVKNGKAKNTPCTHFCIEGTSLCGYHTK